MLHHMVTNFKAQNFQGLGTIVFSKDGRIIQYIRIEPTNFKDTYIHGFSKIHKNSKIFLLQNFLAMQYQVNPSV